MPERIPVVIDTDNSLGMPDSEVDDAFAIAAAVATEQLELLCLTTVHGNAGLTETTHATRDLLHRLGRDDITVAAGSGRPLVRALRKSIPDAPDDDAALDALSAAIRSRPGEIIVITLGPLTNLAKLFTREPDLAGLVGEIVGMGGTYLRTTGRLDLPGEFNMWLDPEAAAAVFASGAPIRMVGLDVTEQVRLTQEDAAALIAAGGVAAHLGDHAAQWISAVARRRPADPRAQTSCGMHDAMAIAAVAHPDFFEWRHARLEVETSSDLTRGVVVADLRLTADPPAPNARIAVDVRETAAIDWLLQTLQPLSSGGA